MTFEPIRLGVVGLGRAFVLMLPAFRADPRFRLVAAAEPRAESRSAFESDFGGKTYSDIKELCTDPRIEAVYIASPHEFHGDHAVLAAGAGKHLLVDKPLAINLSEGGRIITAARAGGVHLITGPSHSFDAPVKLAADIIESGEFGRLRMIQALNYTDFLYRPRRPEELSTASGGGVIFSQAVHQIDVVRLLAGSKATRLVAMTGNWDAARPTEGAFSALMQFESGTFATLTYSGYAHFDSDLWMNNISELGTQKPPAAYGNARRTLAQVPHPDEIALKTARTYMCETEGPRATEHEHFGPVIALCDHADLKLTPSGVEIFADTSRSFRAAPAPDRPRGGVLDALWGAVRADEEPIQTGEWGLASLEACQAILESARTGLPVGLKHQISVPSWKGTP
ncbi:Gfo/Idh/MocA family oxidoreductase [Sulfitobacter sp. F26204]|uniref:Gfo/Idh/MocA family oxidoreductase n=1 Tax=Sulfitobacter sp. F26204 TaxID=2996014 RepID=UPI00225E1FFC|nr:Gfo/Idh/MocA family oxidoreductase [Sulfitobacter sp. F26204]MCX7560633.1 Gfo/Idh/MocA family oxidoreductase [Sulfitobacter sp. F26204]